MTNGKIAILDRKATVGLVAAANLNNIHKHKDVGLGIGTEFMRMKYGPATEALILKTGLDKALLGIANEIAGKPNQNYSIKIDIGAVLDSAIYGWTKHKAEYATHTQRLYFSYENRLYVLKYQKPSNARNPMSQNTKQSPFALSINRKDDGITGELISRYDNKHPEKNAAPLLSLYFMSIVLSIGGDGMKNAIEGIREMLLPAEKEKAEEKPKAPTPPYNEQYF